GEAKAEHDGLAKERLRVEGLCVEGHAVADTGDARRDRSRRLDVARGFDLVPPANAGPRAVVAGSPGEESEAVRRAAEPEVRGAVPVTEVGARLSRGARVVRDLRVTRAARGERRRHPAERRARRLRFLLR